MFAVLQIYSLSNRVMKVTERIQLALQTELEPLGFRYLKSRTTFVKHIDKNTSVELVYDADCFHHGFTDITLLSGANYRDIEEILHELKNVTVARPGAVVCRLQWILPEGESSNIDFNFHDNISEEVFRQKLEKLIWRMKTYALPYIERLSNKDSAIEETAILDKQGLIFQEGVVPVMYCAWKHDKKAALDYLEEKRSRLLKRVKPNEWNLLERFNNGEQFGDNNPYQAANYNVFMSFVNRFKEWVEE